MVISVSRSYRHWLRGTSIAESRLDDEHSRPERGCLRIRIEVEKERTYRRSSDSSPFEYVQLAFEIRLFLPWDALCLELLRRMAKRWVRSRKGRNKCAFFDRPRRSCVQNRLGKCCTGICANTYCPFLEIIMDNREGFTWVLFSPHFFGLFEWNRSEALLDDFQRFGFMAPASIRLDGVEERGFFPLLVSPVEEGNEGFFASWRCVQMEAVLKVLILWQKIMLETKQEPFISKL